MSKNLSNRLSLVSRTWKPHQRLHVGNVAWAHSRGDGSPPPDVTMSWGEPLLGFADIWQGASAGGTARASVHVSPLASARHRALAVQDLLAAVPLVSLEASRQDAALVATLEANGFRESDGPWSVQLWRTLDDLSDLDHRLAPDGYTIRSVDLANDDEVHERVEVHRRSWAPARIKTLLGLDVTGGEQASGYSTAKHEAVMASPVYRRALDLVAAAPDGSFAAYGLGWLDEHHGSVLFEPIGTDPAHGGRGLARAVCAQLLRVARGLGRDRSHRRTARRRSLPPAATRLRGGRDARGRPVRALHQRLELTRARRWSGPCAGSRTPCVQHLSNAR